MAERVVGLLDHGSAQRRHPAVPRHLDEPLHVAVVEHGHQQVHVVQPQQEVVAGVVRGAMDARERERIGAGRAARVRAEPRNRDGPRHDRVDVEERRGGVWTRQPPVDVERHTGTVRPIEHDLTEHRVAGLLGLAFVAQIAKHPQRGATVRHPDQQVGILTGSQERLGVQRVAEIDALDGQRFDAGIVACGEDQTRGAVPELDGRGLSTRLVQEPGRLVRGQPAGDAALDQKRRDRMTHRAVGEGTRIHGCRSFAPERRRNFPLGGPVPDAVSGRHRDRHTNHT
jgi:hypothetical protein